MYFSSLYIWLVIWIEPQRLKFKLLGGEESKTAMDIEQAGLEPLSSAGQWISNSVLSLSVIGVLESQVPIDDSQTMPLFRDVFLLSIHVFPLLQ